MLRHQLYRLQKCNACNANDSSFNFSKKMHWHQQHVWSQNKWIATSTHGYKKFIDAFTDIIKIIQDVVTNIIYEFDPHNFFANQKCSIILMHTYFQVHFPLRRQKTRAKVFVLDAVKHKRSVQNAAWSNTFVTKALVVMAILSNCVASHSQLTNF